MKEIGGFFELELQNGKEYHKNAIRLNSGRNAFEYILRAKEYRKVYLPYYTCDAMFEPINKLKLKHEFYHINEKLEPIFNFSNVGSNEAFVFTNYFGIKNRFIIELSNICPNLIIDNSQAFFEKPCDRIDTFYSPRKFFGVPDGAYLYTDKKLAMKLEQDISIDRFSHLIKRIDNGASSGYKDFKLNDDLIKDQPIKLMSALTRAILDSIDYIKIIKARKRNFQFFHKYLKDLNKFKLSEVSDFVPLVYPFRTTDENLRSELIKNNIYVPIYWPNVLDWCTKDMLEYKLAKQIIPLPIDQRYDVGILSTVIKIIK